VRAALAGGAILLAGWLTALTLGAFGGFETLPDLRLGGRDEPRSAATAGDPPTSAVSAQTTEAGTSSDRASGDGSDAGAGEGGPPRAKPVRTPQRGRGVTTAPGQTTAGTSPGNANGHSPTKTTGKPADTPGNGSAGSNAGGNGNGQANGHPK
jgi:hypothetical protein